MKAKAGIALITVGVILIACSLLLLGYNMLEQKRAAKSVDVLMPQLAEAIEGEHADSPSPILPDPNRQMPVREIDGNDYIGFVGLPSLHLELPVMSEWSDSGLRIAPCRYYGSLYQNNLVIMGHNYRQHFGSLSKLSVGDSVTFTDMDGITARYMVAALDVLAASDQEEMLSGEYDLTLFTCTYDNRNRITVRCNRTETQ